VPIGANDVSFCDEGNDWVTAASRAGKLGLHFRAAGVAAWDYPAAQP